MRIRDLEIENRHLRETINDYNRDFKVVRNQEVTIKLLREKVREFEEKQESTVQDKAEEKDPELLHLFDEKEPDQTESRFAVKTNLEEAETKVAQLQSALDRSQSELFDLKSKYDEDSNAKSDEMEIIVNDLERANQRAALAEKEVNHLKDQLAAAKQSLQLADQIQKAPDMEQAVDVVARSSLELELASKEKEISQLLDDIQRLQTILNALQETSASKIAQLEELVNEKDKMIVELGEKLVRQQDYEEIKKELSILKNVEYNSSRTWESDENKNQSDKPPDLIKENHKSANSENNPVKLIKTEENGSSQNYPLQSVDSFGTMLGQEIVTNYAQNVAKEEVCSRPSSPVSKITESYPPSSTSITSTISNEDRKPSPPALEASSEVSSPPLQLAVNLTSERASPSTNNPLKNIASPIRDNPSLGKLQDCLRHNIDKYANETLNTMNISRCVRELLSVHNIGQRLFAKFVLGLSQGTVSELLSKPKPWDKLTEKGRDSYRKMHAWASDDKCIGMLKSLVPRRVAERRSTLLSSPPGKDCVGGSGGGAGGLSSYKADDQGAEERIAQILNEAQMAMMKQQEQKSPSSLPNGSNGDNRSIDSCDDIRGDGGNDSKLNHGNSRDASNSEKSFRRSRKYENDDIPQEMVARIYQEELAKLIGQRVEEGFRTPRDQFERTQEEIRQALTIYHQELTRLSHLMPPNHHQNSFNPFTANGSSYSLTHHHNNGNNNSTVNNNNNSGSNSQSLQECPVDATMNNRSRSESKTSSNREEPEMRHHGSAFSLVRPKTETNISSSMNAKSSSTPAASYHLHSSSPAPPALLPLSDSKTSSPSATQSGVDDLATSASPLQRMQSITNSLLSQSSLPSLPNPPQRPAKAVLPPITQQQFDQYNNVNTEDIVKKVKEQLSQYSISQRLFGESVLGLSQGSVSDLLARPKPWHMLTQKGREPFIRMKIFLEDENAVHKLVASQYKIAPEKLMRTGSFGGATNPQSIMNFGSNKMSPRPMESSLRIPDNRQLAQNNVLYSSHNHPPRSICSTPDNNVPMSLTVSSSTTPSSTIHSRKTPTITRGYNQPSVYEMAALTTDLDTQTITSKIKETLMAHNIGQKIFGEAVLGLSQGSVSELLSKPKPWHMLSIKGREPFIRMQMWLNDPHNVEMLQTLKNERREANKRRRTGEGPMDSPRSQSDGGQMYNSYNFAPPSPYPPAKKPRVLFTEEQKEALRLAFSLDPYPSTATIEFLATELNLSVRTITNWFHNHRMRMKQHASPDDDHSRKGSDLSLPPPVREGMAFDPMQYRMLLNQRLAEKCREKGGPQFLSHFGGSMPYLYSPYRNCSPLSSSGDDVGTLDLSMSSQLRNAINSGVKADTNGSSTDDRSNSEMNDDSNLSQDNLIQGDNSDRESVDDGQQPSHRQDSSPLRPPAASEQVRPTPSAPVSGSSNRRKPAMPQWVDPGLELSPDNSDDEEEDLDEENRLDDESATEQEEIINGVCVRQTEDFDLLLPPRVETVHVLPVPAPDDRSSSKCHPHRNDKSRRTATVSPDRSDNEMEGLTNGLNDREPSEQSENKVHVKEKLLSVNMVDSTTLKKPVFLDEQDDDESWDDAEAKDRRKNIEKLQQRLENEDVGEDWEF